MSVVFLIPLITFTSVQFTYDFSMQKFYGRLGQSLGDLDKDWLSEIPDKTLKAFATEFSHASAWGISIFVFLILQAVSIVAALTVIKRHLSPMGMDRAVKLSLATVSFGLLLFLLQFACLPQYRFPTTEVLIDAIVDHTKLDSVKSLLSLATKLIPVTGFLFAFAYGSLLQETVAENSEEKLYRQMHDARLLLVVFSLMIVAGTIEVRLLYSWPASWLKSPDDANAISNLASTVSGLAGVKHSAMLLLMCSPLFVVFNRRAYTIACRTKPEFGDRHKWMIDSGLASSLPEQLATVGAMIAPAFSNAVLNSFAVSVSKI